MVKTEDDVRLFLNQFPNNKTVCISFHLAEHPINYAFK